MYQEKAFAIDVLPSNFPTIFGEFYSLFRPARVFFLAFKDVESCDVVSDILYRLCYELMLVTVTLDSKLSKFIDEENTGFPVSNESFQEIVS